MRRRHRPEQPDGEVVGAERVGALLRERRAARGLSVEDVGQALRCGAPRIRALEEGRCDQLPQQPYANGLIAAYGALVGMDGPALVRAWGSGRRPCAVAPGGVLRRPPQERFNWRDWAAPLGFAGVLAALVATRALFVPPPPPPEEPTAAVAVPAVPASPVQQEFAAPPTGLAGHAETSGSSGPAASPEAAALAPATPPGPASGVRVLLRSVGTTWVEASPDGGEPRRHELGPGENLELTARERLALTLGDAGVLRIRLNERELGFIGYKGETRTGVAFTAPKAAPAAAPEAARARPSGD